jgi:site-specific DNA recombinase
MSSAVFAVIAALPEFDSALLELLHVEVQSVASNNGAERLRLQRQLDQVEQGISNLMRAVREAGHSELLMEEIRRLERERANLHAALADATSTPSSPPIRMPSVREIREQAEVEFGKLTIESSEFARYMRQVVPRIVVYPVRLCDGGHVGLRATLNVSLTSLIPATWQSPTVNAHLTTNLEVDLFEMPQRAAFRRRVVQMYSDGLLNEQIARDLRITLPAVARAKGLQKLMDSVGLTDPYLRLEKPPEDYKKMRRHLHSRYRFNSILPDATA